MDGIMTINIRIFRFQFFLRTRREYDILEDAFVAPCLRMSWYRGLDKPTAVWRIV